MPQESSEMAAAHLEEAADLVLHWLQQGAELVQEQAPLLVEEVIRWGVVGNLLALLASLIGIFFTYKLSQVGVKLYKGVDDTALPGVFIIAFALGLTSLLIGAESIYTLAKVLSAPRLYLLDVLSALAK